MSDSTGPTVLISVLGAEPKVGKKLPLEHVQMSGMIGNMVERNDEEDYDEVVLPSDKVPEDIFEAIVNFITHYKTVEPLNDFDFGPPTSGRGFDEVVSQEWYRNFINQFEGTSIIPVIKAADFLDIKPLVDLAMLKMCATIKGKTEKEIKLFFNI